MRTSTNTYISCNMQFLSDYASVVTNNNRNITGAASRARSEHGVLLTATCLQMNEGIAIHRYYCSIALGFISCWNIARLQAVGFRQHAYHLEKKEVVSVDKMCEWR